MELTANAAQTVMVGSNVLFTDTPIPGNCSILHREGSGITTLRGACSQSRARFRVTFTANVAAPAGTTNFTPLSMAIALNGEGVVSTMAISTPTAAGVYQNICTTAFVDVPKCCCTQLSIKNIGADTVSVANSNLLVERVA